MSSKILVSLCSPVTSCLLSSTSCRWLTCGSSRSDPLTNPWTAAPWRIFSLAGTSWRISHLPPSSFTDGGNRTLESREFVSMSSSLLPPFLLPQIPVLITFFASYFVVPGAPRSVAFFLSVTCLRPSVLEKYFLLYAHGTCLACHGVFCSKSSLFLNGSNSVNLTF